MSARERKSRPTTSLRELAIVVLFMVGVAILVTWPLARSPATRSLATAAEADPLLNQYLIAWPVHAWTSPEAELFHTNMFHPERYTFAYSDMMLSSSLLAYPVLRAGGSPNLAYNLLLLASIVIGGIGVHALARSLGLPVVAGLAGGVLYAANPAHMARIGHIQLFSDHWLPWVLLATLVWLASCGLRDGATTGTRAGSVARAAAVATLFAAHALTGSHNAVFGALVLGLVLLAHLGGSYRRLRGPSGSEARWRLLAGGAVLAGVCLLILGPVFYPYLLVYEHLAEGRLGDPGEQLAVIEGGSAGVKELLTGASPFWQRVERLTGWPGEWIAPGRRLRAHLFPGLTILLLGAAGAWPLRPRGAPRLRGLIVGLLDLVGMATALGAVAVALTGRYYWALLGMTLDLPSVLPLAAVCILAVVGRWILDRHRPHLLESAARALDRRWSRHRDRLLWTGIALVCLALAMGPEGGLYWLARSLPGIGLIRAPSRFLLPGLVACAVLAAIGVADLRRRLPPTTALITGLAIVGLFAVEARMAPLRLGPVPYPRAELSGWLAEQPGDFAVLEFPVDTRPPAAVRQMLRSLEHHKKLLIGYSGSAPPGYAERMEWLQENLPSETALQRLRELDVRYLIVDPMLASAERVEAFSRAPGLRRVNRFDQRTVYEILPQ